MRFTDDFMDEIKARVRVSDVVGRHVKLKRQGREFAGLSPFTNEKTPSFFVNDEKGFYHCFSSGNHGDAISFLMDVQGQTFPEAVETLAGLAGVAMPAADPKAEQRAAENKKSISWIEASKVFYEKSLRRNVGAAARDYLKSRGLTGEDCARFGIGFAPDSFDALRDELITQGAQIQQLVDAGLVIVPDDKSRQPWDRFRNRIMFPIADSRGRLIAFGGRAMEKDAKAKYLNSPETSLFHKGSVLYRYSDARKALNAPGNAARGLIVAEGYMDVIALARAGFEHAVAPLGTALTEDQLELLWRAGPEPILCFDGDKAGLRAAFRSIERALPLLKPGQTIRFALLPDNMDPDDLIRERGARAMAEVLDNAVPLIDMLWRRELEAEDLSTPEARAGLKDRLYKAQSEIAHPGVREQYKTALLTRFDKAYGAPAKSYGQGGYGKSGYGRKKGAAPPSSALKMKMEKARAMNADRGPAEKRLVGAILEYPQLLRSVDEIFFELKFDTPMLVRLQTGIFEYWRDAIAVDKNAIRAHIEGLGLRQALNIFSSFGQDMSGMAIAPEDADLKTVEKEWLREAAIHQEQDVAGEQRAEFRDRMNAVLRADDREAMLKLMRATSAARRQTAARTP